MLKTNYTVQNVSKGKSASERPHLNVMEGQDVINHIMGINVHIFRLSLIKDIHGLLSHLPTAGKSLRIAGVMVQLFQRVTKMI